MASLFTHRWTWWLAIVVLCVLPGLAYAQAHLHDTFVLTLQNQSGQSISLAWVYQNTVQDDWISEGWLELAPDQTRILELEGGCPASVGIYAKTQDGLAFLQGSDPRFTAMLDQEQDFSFMLKRRNFTPTASVIHFYKLGVHHSSSSYRYIFK